MKYIRPYLQFLLLLCCPVCALVVLLLLSLLLLLTLCRCLMWREDVYQQLWVQQAKNKQTNK